MQSKNKGILCPNCGKIVSSDEPVCPYCGHRRPGARWKSGIGKSLFADPTDLVRFIIYINVGMFILSLLLSAQRIGMGVNPLGMLSPDNRVLLALGESGAIPVFRDHRWWTLISANYLHGGLLHIIFNMLAFNQLGPLVIREFGPFRFLVIYCLGGAIGFFLSSMAGVAYTIGASASICALIGAILYYSKSRGGTYGHALYRQVSGWVLGLFVFGLLVPGIDNWGHGGGLLGGVLLGYLIGYSERRPENFIHRLFAYCLVSVTGFILAGVVSSVIISLFGR